MTPFLDAGVDVVLLAAGFAALWLERHSWRAGRRAGRVIATAGPAVIARMLRALMKAPPPGPRTPVHGPAARRASRPAYPPVRPVLPGPGPDDGAGTLTAAEAEAYDALVAADRRRPLRPQTA